jgi:hypothetical protein
MRSVINEAVLRAVEGGKKTVSASLMHSVLRKYAENMEFTSVETPLGLLRFAQKEGVLGHTDADLEAKADEKKANAANKKLALDFAKAEEARLLARREAVAAKKAAA